MNNFNDVWKTTLAQIEVKLDSPIQFKTWFKDTSLIYINGNEACIGVKNSYTADWLARKHYQMIRETLSYVYDKNLDIKFKVDKNLVNMPTNINGLAKERPLFGIENGIGVDLKNSLESSGLNPQYTFNSFVVGESNNIAHAAAMAVSENPGTVYNPLFIHGNTGLGKTHLAQAIGRQVLDKTPQKKIVYVTSEAFMNDMVKAIQTGKNIEFRRRFRLVDVFIIDDIQLIAKWPKTQVEFFNTFNELYNSQKQIILISDKGPDMIKDINDRLRSRFQGGMVVEIYKPDFETRLAIVAKKSQQMGINLPSFINEYLASEITDNVRDLEGAIQKVSLYNSMANNELTIEEVARILRRDPQSKRERIKVPSILKRVGKEYEVSIKDLKGNRRTAQIAFARQVAMYILREEFKYQLEKIASFLNRKDHTTVIHAVDKIKSKVMVDEGFREQVSLIIQDLKEESV